MKTSRYNVPGTNPVPGTNRRVQQPPVRGLYPDVPPRCSWLRRIRENRPIFRGGFVLSVPTRLQAHEMAMEAGHHVCPEQP